MRWKSDSIDRRTVLLGLAGGLLVGTRARSADDPVLIPTDGPPEYDHRVIEGWPILIHKGFLSGNPRLADQTLTLLARQLGQIAQRLPASAVQKLRATWIWVEENEPHHPCMAYHPDPRWLIDHGMNPGKARGVEVANARNFLEWTKQQPWMVLHELAHAYHHKVLPQGFENPEVKQAFDRAIQAKLYDSVLRVGGKREKAYATTNPMEYFAETTEAFFGSNDFFPFHRSELERHDPELFALLKRLWNETSPTG